MWKLEVELQKKLIQMLDSSRTLILANYCPFPFSKLSVDIKAFINNTEEWRELKLLYYNKKRRHIQNLWKGIGKVLVMQDLALEYISDRKVCNILTLPEFDFFQITEEIRITISKLVPIELVTENNFYYQNSLDVLCHD